MTLVAVVPAVTKVPATPPLSGARSTRNPVSLPELSTQETFTFAVFPEPVAPAEVLAVAKQIAALPALQIEGLMTVAPLVHDPEEVRPVFRELRLLRDRLRDEIPAGSWAQRRHG